MPHSYRQPEKNAVRERVLTAAIDALTKNRSESAIVAPDELSDTIEYAMQDLAGTIDRESLNNEFDNWRQGYRNHIGRKEPSELRVLYLCGPEPLNDLSILIDKGVLPQNVWAVEENLHDVARAASDLSRTYPVVRLHPGSLEDLFQVYPGRFDIVYFDACGSLFTRGVLNVLLTLSAQAKLEPMAALITNFANFDGAGEDRDAMRQFFRYRYNDLPQVAHGYDEPAMFPTDDSGLKWCMQQDIEPFYSDFITRFITDLFRYWIPNTRALALRAVNRHYMADHRNVMSQMEEAVGLPRKIGPMLLSPSDYPVFSFYRQLKEMNHPLASTIGNFKIGGQEIGRLLGYSSMLDGVLNGHWPALSQPMMAAITQSWFDRDRQFSCETPMPNLLINSLLGIYGYPHFPNVRRSDRFSYTAKETKMFTDVFVFDQCRYYFDWFPTILLAPARFQSKEFQVLARCILDRIGRMDARCTSHPFRYSAVAGHGLNGVAEAFNIKVRHTLTA